jgi:autotransporter-associated beta strand protein
MVISNNSKIYTFSGSGRISGSTGLQKLGSNTAVLSVSNNNYSGNTVIGNGTLQVASASAISPTANLVIAAGGTLELSTNSQTAGELTGSGVVDNNSGIDVVLTVGSSSGGTWNGSIQDHGGGGIALTKNGAGTWFVGGSNRLANGSAFTIQTIFNGGTTILTNGGSMIVPIEQTWIANGANTATMIVDGGLLAVSNNILTVGNGAGANGTLIVNNGTVIHGGNPNNAFGNANNLFIGGGGGTGTLIVNGGQVLNSQVLALGENTGASGTLHLNGGLVQATQVRPNGTTPTTSIAYFNGGTLQAVNTNADFIQSTAMVQAGGAVLDDGGFAIHLVTAGLQEDVSSPGGGLVKKGSGTVYLDGFNSYTGTTMVNAGTLAGIGSVSGPVVVSATGNIGAGDPGFVGTFSLNSQPLTLLGQATFRIAKDGGFPTSDLIAGITTANYGGTLVVTNITSDSTALVAGDTFTLFTATTHSGSFNSIVGSAGTGLGYTFTNGVLHVVTHNVFDDPTPILFSVSGSSLTLSWAADHTGWILQSQTNSLSVGLTTTWFDIVGSGSGNSVTVPLSPGNPSVFFRLRHP